MPEPVKKIYYKDLTPGKQQTQLQQLSPEQSQQAKQIRRLIRLSKDEEE